MSGEIPSTLREIARLQSGVVSRQQALTAGLSAGVIVSKLRHERWQQIHRGVYATFTGPVHREALLWAAVLYAGKGARLSHETAAELHGLTTRRASLIHVTVPASRRVRPAAGMLIHISGRLREEACFVPGALPRTPLEDTILDLAGAARSLDDARDWITRAVGCRLAGAERLSTVMDSRKRLRWRAQLAETVTAAATRPAAAGTAMTSALPAGPGGYP